MSESFKEALNLIEERPLKNKKEVVKKILDDPTISFNLEEFKKVLPPKEINPEGFIQNNTKGDKINLHSMIMAAIYGPCIRWRKDVSKEHRQHPVSPPDL